jgi:hypothetical protein
MTNYSVPGTVDQLIINHQFVHLNSTNDQFEEPIAFTRVNAFLQKKEFLKVLNKKLKVWHANIC